MIHQPNDSDAGLPPCGGSGEKDPQANGVAVLRTKNGMRVAINCTEVEAVMELDDGCEVVTSSDTYVVQHAWPEVAGLVWPELFR